MISETLVKDPLKQIYKKKIEKKQLLPFYYYDILITDWNKEKSLKLIIKNK